ncbi:HK97 family phage prohead protease [Clostridium sp. DSM 8431]|uniref:HK97 family phage prohead protease n=1 Tax=Clostridium sp. DSM 8431 TaxID=1761781 RepID=UPI001FA8348E|nr:HK97 family phage prohead protease [Clostridium sp. DSM 8431]
MFLLNHDENKKLGSTKEGNLELFEDNIGLRAICTITDRDVIEKAKKGKLRGWSFGFAVNKDRWEDILIKVIKEDMLRI